MWCAWNQSVSGACVSISNELNMSSGGGAMTAKELMRWCSELVLGRWYGKLAEGARVGGQRMSQQCGVLEIGISIGGLRFDPQQAEHGQWGGWHEEVCGWVGAVMRWACVRLMMWQTRWARSGRGWGWPRLTWAWQGAWRACVQWSRSGGGRWHVSAVIVPTHTWPIWAFAR